MAYGGAQVTPRGNSGLSRDAVARAALDLLDREGLDALSMRRLADALGVGTMTLYGYFRNKEELLAAVVDEAFASFVPPPPTDDVRAGIREFTLAARDVLQRHPVLVEIRASGPIIRPRAFAVTEFGVARLVDAGLGPEDAVRCFRLLFDYVFGYAFVNRRPASPELQREALASIVALPPGEFPALAAAAEEMAAAAAGDSQFEYGLERILDGIEAQLAASRAGTTASAAAPAARRRRTGPRAR